jgi:hypothetical protein
MSEKGEVKCDIESLEDNIETQDPLISNNTNDNESPDREETNNFFCLLIIQT